MSYQFTARDAEQAHAQVAAAIRDGRLVRQPCEACGSDLVQAHHDDYGTLKVRWLCRRHHREHHAKHRSDVDWTISDSARTMTIRFSRQHRQFIEERASEQGISPSEFVRYLVMKERRSK